MLYSPVIGLEIHVQAKTKSKMFCRCNAEYFQNEPNTNVCPVCFGLPGALPLPNKLAIEKCIKLALSLNCSINKETKFDRKNYFYPDLPKGYQISQYDQPIGFDGFLEFEINDDARRIRIKRVHMEEDTAKSLHEGTDTLIDFNKSGVPLIEIVTEPDFESVEEVLIFAKRLRQIIRYTDTSDAEMQKGQMRYELNISVRQEQEVRSQKSEKIGQGLEVTAKQPAQPSTLKPHTSLPNYKVEVKNIGSISVLEKVINFEIKRQSELLEKGETLVSETRGLKDMTGETLPQRIKETADDYRYFPEPDIPPIIIAEEEIETIKASMPELPDKRKQRYLGLGLNPEQAEVFVENSERGSYFDEVLELAVPDGRQGSKQHESGNNEFAKLAARLINTDLAGLLEKSEFDIINSKVTSNKLSEIVSLIVEKKINNIIAKRILETVFNTGRDVEEIINTDGLLSSTDSSEIDQFINQVIFENPKVVEDSKKNPNAAKFFVGQVMRLAKGKADPVTVETEIKRKLGI